MFVLFQSGCQGVIAAFLECRLNSFTQTCRTMAVVDEPDPLLQYAETLCMFVACCSSVVALSIHLNGLYKANLHVLSLKGWDWTFTTVAMFKCKKKNSDTI